MEKLFKIISVFIIQLMLMQGVSLAQEIDCLSPAMSLNTWELQQSTREMILKQHIDESLLSTFDYYKLNLNILFGTKIRAKNIEQSLRKQLSPRKIMLYVKAESASASVKDDLRKNIFEPILEEYAPQLIKSMTMMQYLDIIMQLLYQELEQGINSQWPVIIENIENRLKNLDPEEILVYNQASNSIQKHKVREKVINIAVEKLEKHGIFFNKRVEEEIDSIMLKLEQGLRNKVIQAVDTNKAQLIHRFSNALSTKEQRSYFSNQALLNGKKLHAQAKTKSIFNDWLKEHNIYYEGKTWKYYYTFIRDSIVGELVKGKDPSNPVRFKPDIKLKSSNNEAFKAMVTEVKKGNYKDATDLPLIQSAMIGIQSRLELLGIRRAKETKALVSGMPSFDQNFSVFITDAVIIDSRNYCFGFLSHNPAIRSKLKNQLGGEKKFNEIFPEPTIVLSREMYNLSFTHQSVFKEYLYLIAQSSYGVSTFFQTQKIFSENYKGFLEGKDYEINIILDTKKSDMPIVLKPNSMYKIGHKGHGNYPFKGLVGQILLEKVKEKFIAGSFIGQAI